MTSNLMMGCGLRIGLEQQSFDKFWALLYVKFVQICQKNVSTSNACISFIRCRNSMIFISTRSLRSLLSVKIGLVVWFNLEKSSLFKKPRVVRFFLLIFSLWASYASISQTIGPLALKIEMWPFNILRSMFISPIAFEDFQLINSNLQYFMRTSSNFYLKSKNNSNPIKSTCSTPKYIKNNN